MSHIALDSLKLTEICLSLLPHAGITDYSVPLRSSLFLFYFFLSLKGKVYYLFWFLLWKPLFSFWLPRCLLELKSHGAGTRLLFFLLLVPHIGHQNLTILLLLFNSLVGPWSSSQINHIWRLILSNECSALSCLVSFQLFFT